MTPTRGNGKICYVEIPATDIQRSAEFYLGRPAAEAPGLLIYVMVDSVIEAVAAIIGNGGEIARPIGADAPEITARFRDPAGNVLGLYQEPAR